MLDINHDQHNLTIQAGNIHECNHFADILREKFPQMPVMTLVEMFPDDLTVYVEAPESDGWQTGELESVVEAFTEELMYPSCPSDHICCAHCGSYQWTWLPGTASRILTLEPLIRCQDCGKDS